MIADLAELSGGRAMVGLGAGVKPQLNRFFGIVGDQAEHPAPRIREFVELLRELTGTTRSRAVGRPLLPAAGRARAPARRTPCRSTSRR